MNPRFDVRFGQELCDLLSTELGLVCSFMGEQGHIVASSERERIGCPHAMAGRIMRGELDEYGVSREEAAESPTMREGLNMGLDVEGVRLICFAIAGPLEIVRPLARLVCFSVTSLLRVRQQGPLPVAASMAGLAAVQPARLTDLLNHASDTIECSLTRLRDAVDHIDQGLTMFDSSLRLVVWNRRGLELLDLPEQAVAFGLSLEAIIRYCAGRAGQEPAAVEVAVTRRLALVHRREVHRFEHAMPNGIILEIVDRPLATGGFVSTCTDVTERRQGELALRTACRQAERRVQARTRDLLDFAELSSDWFWEQDAQFRFTRFFGQATEKLRRRQSDFFGQRRWDMPIHGVSERQLAQHIATHERHESFRNFEYEIPGSDGSTQYFFVSGAPVVDAQGVFVGYHGIGSNITELRLAERAIKDRERQLSQIVDGSSIPTFVIDARHRVTHWNQACVSLTGLTASDMLGSQEVWRAFYRTPRPTLAALVVAAATDETLAAHYPQFSRSVLIAGAIEAESFHPHMGEGGRWLYFTGAPLRDADGTLCGAMETIQDITERRRDQKLLENRTQALQTAYGELEAKVTERTAELSQQLHFLQQLVEAIPGPVFYKDADSRYLGCNSAFEAFIGQSARQLIGKRPRDIAPGELADRYAAADRELFDHPGVQIYESQVRYASGELRDVMFHKATFTRPDGSVGGLVGVMLDITERKRMEDDLRQAATVFDSSAEAVTIATPDGTIIAVNRAFTEITGYDEGDAIGRNPRMLQSGRHDQAFYREMWDELTRNGRWQGEIWNRRKSGEIFPEWISITAVYDQQDRVSNYVATFSDITQKKQTEERIQLLAFTDPLTSLPNRRLLLDRLQHALKTSLRSKRHGALFFIDLDDFKGLNDTRGHHVGDLLLKQVGQRLVECAREGDTVARLGGDEFVLLLEDLAHTALEAISQTESLGAKILTTLNQPYVLAETRYHGTASVGVTLFGAQQSSLEDVLKQADLAMYRAKSSGRNTLRFFDPEMQSAVAARFGLEADLRQGLLQEQFVLYYQPQIDHASRITGVEALLRWRHPERGLVLPGDFIALAEETNLILPLGLWVLQTACAQLSAWAKRADTAHLTMAVNVSACQLHQRDFVGQVLAVLDRHAVEPGKLKIELTESLLLDDVEDVIAKMSALKARGVCFSLDDFGTGYSSLSYLKRLPLDQLKIDQSFVRDVLLDANDAAIARTIVALAHSLGLGVIAEGVETQEQRLFLARNHCLAYQGNLFSGPVPLNEFERLLSSTRRCSSDADRSPPPGPPVESGRPPP